MRYLARHIPHVFWTRHCTGCQDDSFHNAHLTWLGRLWLWGYK